MGEYNGLKIVNAGLSEQEWDAAYYSCYCGDEEQVIITKEAEDIHGLLDCMVSGSAG